MSEAANPEGADARSPEERASRIMGLPRGPEYPNREIHARLAAEIREAELAAESRGAKAGRAEAAEYLERSAQDMRMRGAPWTGFGLLVMHAQRIRSLSAEGATPSGSPSVPAAQPRREHGPMTCTPTGCPPECYEQGAPTRETPAPLASLAAPSHPVSLGKDVWIGEVRPTVEALEAATRRPRAAPSAREVPEPGGTLAGLLADLREARESNKALTAAGLKLAEQLHEARRGTAPSSPESPAVAAVSGDCNHE